MPNCAPYNKMKIASSPGGKKRSLHVLAEGNENVSYHCFLNINKMDRVPCFSLHHQPRRKSVLSLHERMCLSYTASRYASHNSINPPLLPFQIDAFWNSHLQPIPLFMTLCAKQRISRFSSFCNSFESVC